MRPVVFNLFVTIPGNAGTLLLALTRSQLHEFDINE